MVNLVCDERTTGVHKADSRATGCSRYSVYADRFDGDGNLRRTAHDAGYRSGHRVSPGGFTEDRQLFRADCYVNEDSIRNAVIRRSMFNIIHNEWMVKADFIVRGDEEYRKLEFERRRRFDIDGTPIWVVAPEDLILSKLEWSRESSSALQQRDVQVLMEEVIDLDWSYLESWAERLGMKVLLDQVKKR